MANRREGHQRFSLSFGAVVKQVHNRAHRLTAIVYDTSHNTMQMLCVTKRSFCIFYHTKKSEEKRLKTLPDGCAERCSWQPQRFRRIVKIKFLAAESTKFSNMLQRSDCIYEIVISISFECCFFHLRVEYTYMCNVEFVTDRVLYSSEVHISKKPNNEISISVSLWNWLKLTIKCNRSWLIIIPEKGTSAEQKIHKTEKKRCCTWESIFSS